MRTKRFLTAAAAMLAMFAVIGSGFSYWFFQTSDQTTADQTAGKEVTQLVAVGEVTAADNFTIVFDQTEAGRKAHSGANSEDKVNLGTNDATTGITLSFAGTDKTVSYTDPATSNIGVDQISDKVGFTFTTTVTITKALGEYFDMAYASDEGWTVARTEDDTNVVITFTSTTKREFDWEKVTLSYTVGGENKEPASASAYNTFASVVNADGNTVSVAYSVVVATID